MRYRYKFLLCISRLCFCLMESSSFDHLHFNVSSSREKLHAVLALRSYRVTVFRMVYSILDIIRRCNHHKKDSSHIGCAPKSGKLVCAFQRWEKIVKKGENSQTVPSIYGCSWQLPQLEMFLHRFSIQQNICGSYFNVLPNSDPHQASYTAGDTPEASTSNLQWLILEWRSQALAFVRTSCTLLNENNRLFLVRVEDSLSTAVQNLIIENLIVSPLKPKTLAALSSIISLVPGIAFEPCIFSFNTNGSLLLVSNITPDLDQSESFTLVFDREATLKAGLNSLDILLL